MPDLTSCPFYGVDVIEFAKGELPSSAVLATKGDHRCGLMTESVRPCVVQLAGDRPDYRECIRNPVNNGSGFETGIPVSDVATVHDYGSSFERAGHDKPDTPDTVAEKAYRCGHCGAQIDDPERHTCKFVAEREAAAGDRLKSLVRADPAPLIDKIEGRR